jgi:hypothetical protein
MANTHRVLRPFQAEMLRNPGDLVDASEWKNVKALEDQRYIERIDTETPYIGGAGPSPDPKLIQESVARKARSKNSDSGGIAAMPEVEEQLSAAARGGEKVNDGEQDNVKQLRGKLPEDFPGHAALEAEGVTTYAQVRKRIKEGTLKGIPGIGDATAAKIEEAAGMSDETDDE